MGMLGAGLSLAGGVVGAVGAEQNAKATSEADFYQSQILQQNAQLAEQKAQFATEEGGAEAERKELATKANVGQIKAAQGASNIDVNSGSSVKVQRSAAELGALDAVTLRSNAARAAYGYQVQALSDTEQAGLEATSAANAKTAGNIQAISSLIGGASSAGSQYAQWSQLTG